MYTWERGSRECNGFCRSKQKNGRIKEVMQVPRVALTAEKKEEYMVADLPFLFEKEARKRGKTTKDLANALGITPQAFGQRKGKRANGSPRDAFTYGDILKLFRFLEMTEDERLMLFPQLK